MIDYPYQTPNAWCPDCGHGHHCPAKVIEWPNPVIKWPDPWTPNGSGSGPGWYCSSCGYWHYSTTCPGTISLSSIIP